MANDSVQIFGTKKCRDTQKATRFFKERNIKIHFVDLNEKEMSPGELDSVARSVGVENIIDTESKRYKELNLAYIIHDVREKLLEEPLLIKTPVIRFAKKAVCGFDEAFCKSVVSEMKK